MGFAELEDRTALATYQWTGASFNPQQGQGNLWWSNSANWFNATLGVPATAAPGVNDSVNLDGTAPQYNTSLVDQAFGGTIQSLNVTGATVVLNLNYSLTVTSGLTQSNGTIYAMGNQLTLGGTSEWTGGGMSNPSLIINNGAILNKYAAAGMNGGSITNHGTLNLKQNASVVSVTNHGTLNLDSGGGCSVGFSLTNHGTINQPAGNNAISSLDNRGAIFLNGGQLSLSGNEPKQTGAGATITFNGGLMWVGVGGTFLLQAGSLSGSASGSTIIGSVNNSGGTIYAGGTTGTLTINGTYTQGASGTLVVGVNVDGGTSSKLKVTGTASLGGTLKVNWSNGTPAAGSEWEVALFQGGVMMMTDFRVFTSMGSANPTFGHVTGTWNPYKIKVN